METPASAVETKRAAVYLRVSTDKQTVENQRDETVKLCLARGFEPVVYEETESAAKERPVLDRLMEDVRAGKVRAVVVWALDRMDRSMRGCINRVLELDKLGAPIISVRDPWLDTSGPVRSLLVAVLSWVAEQERLRIIERTVTAKTRYAKENRLQARPPYARTWDKATGSWGTDEKELGIYKRIFREYLSGLSCQKIADKLNEEGVPAPGAWWRRKPGTWKHALSWSSGSVYALLSHRSAVGEVSSFGHALTCPAVVDFETFEKVQARLKVKNWLNGRPAARDLLALLRGLLVCKHCGTNVWVARGGSKGRYVLYYRCGRYQSAKEAVCRKGYRVEDVDEKARAVVLSYLDDLDIDGLVQVKHDERELALLATAARKDLDLLKEEGKRISRLIQKELLPEKDGEELLREVQQKRRQAQAQLERSSMSAKAREQEQREAREQADLIRKMRKAIVTDGTWEHWRALTEAVLRGLKVGLAEDGMLAFQRP